MKYKVGDKVKLRKDLEVGKCYGGYDVIRDMLEFAKENNYKATIRKVDWDGYGLENSGYTYTDEMFENDVFVTKSKNNVDGQTVDVGYHLEYCGHRTLKNVWQSGWATECIEKSVSFTSYDCKNQYTLPLSAIDWVIPHED